MARTKQKQIEETGPFTPEEIDRFQMEEAQHYKDMEEMEQELKDARSLSISELQLAYVDMQEWQMTCKYPSESITDAQRRVMIIIKMMQRGILW
tara:strand:+ start:1165 stop:1446 length:282 start_codon:yes stop_codon:yes gene_type:complete